jgi:hypothetical protein
VMIIDRSVEENSSIANKYNLFKVSKNNPSERFLEFISDYWFTIRHMPRYMNNVLRKIAEKSIMCSSSCEMLLNYLGHLSLRLSPNELVSEFGSEEICYYRCIKLVSHGYICRALTLVDSAIDNNNAELQLPFSKDQYRQYFMECKRQVDNVQRKHC